MGKSVIESIDRVKLCLGCGMCEAVCGEDSVKMGIGNDGFIHPQIINNKINKGDERLISKLCPGANVYNDERLDKQDRIWGHILSCHATYSIDKEVRHLGSSGGTISQLCISLIELGKVDGILQVGACVNDYTKNELKLNRTRDEILKCASSRYAPAFVFQDIKNILSKSEERFAFVGKPCDISALNNFVKYFPEFKGRIKYTIAIICAGIPSFKGTENVITKLQGESPVKNLRYRGDGWPGYFSFDDAKGTVLKMSYNDSWGKILGKTVHYRCKICPDGIGMHADIAVGDAWETKEGYPDFKEKPGQSLTLIRTINGEKLFEELISAKVLERRKIEVSKLKEIQPYQYKRRIYVGARLIAFFMIKGKVVNFKKMGICSNVKFANGYIFLREFLGSVKRLSRK
jgi:coenzyme F420 hydrogenase subunit beta